MTPRVARACGAIGVLGATVVGAGRAHAERPDEAGALFHYEPEDVLASVDGPTGHVRVHYSADGPNVTVLTDGDASGYPDFAELVAETAEDVLARLAAAGFRAPLRESEVGLAALGGSDAFDFYLLDFGGSSDGSFGVDGCTTDGCAGHMVMENDFVGYGYPSRAVAVEVLTSHELFHAVQAAYVTGDLPVWFSEGTAAWAELLYDPDSLDFRSFASAYLSDTGRSLDRPPVGPVPAFAYGTCLFFQFLALRLGAGLVPELFEGLVDNAPLDALELAIAAAGSSLRAEWTAFVDANLATGARTGDASLYPFSRAIDGIVPAGEGASLDETHRFYPLAASYFFVRHPGGELWFAAADDPSGLSFSLRSVPAGGQRTAVGEVLESWEPTAAGAYTLGERAAGDYWLRGTYPARATESRRIRFCLGDAAAAQACDPGAAVDAGAGDGGSDDGGSDDGGVLDGGAARRGRDSECAVAPGRGAPRLAVWLVALAGAFAGWRRRSACRGRGASSALGRLSAPRRRAS